MDKPEIVFNAKSKMPVSSNNPEALKRRREEDNGMKSFKRRRITLSDKEKERLRKEYSVVVVNDYNDDYHLSDDEKKEKSRYYEAFAKIRNIKRKFRRLDEFVKAFRLCLDCLEVVAENNGVYDPVKFTVMAIKGDIEVFGLTFPKYIGKDKKSINWEYITDFIMDRSQDPSELSSNNESAISKLDEEEARRQLMSDDEYELMVSKIGTCPPEIQLNPDQEFIDEYGIVETLSKKELKNLIKLQPDIMKTFKEITKKQRRKERNAGRLASFVYEMRDEDFDYIAGIDRKRGYHSTADIPKFQGDIMNRKDFKLYLHALEEYEENQLRENYRGKMRTKAEINEIELKDALESAGWNIRNLYKNKDDEKKLKKAYKRDKKREKELKKRLLAVQERQKKRSGDKIEFNAKDKKKKKKKKKESD